MTILSSLKKNSLYLWDNLRDTNKNLFILNNLLVLFVFSITVSYEISGTLMWIIVLIFIINPEFKQHLVYGLKNKIVQAFLLYFSLYVIWIIGSEDVQRALFFLKFNKVLLYSVIFVAIIQQSFVKKIIYAFILGIMLNVIWSYLMFFGLVSSPWNQGYPYLPLLHKTDHGFFVLILLGYTIFRILKDRKKNLTTLLFFIVFLTESFNIFITGNRTSMVAYFVMLFTSLLLIYRHKLFYISLIFIFISATVGLSVYTLLPSVTKNITKEYNHIIDSFEDSDYDSSSGARIGMIKYSIPTIKENFLFGVGTGDHIMALENEIFNADAFKEKEKFAEILLVISAGYGASLHNTYIQQIVQFGIFGIFVIFYLMYQIFRYPYYAQEEYKFLAYLIAILYLVVMITGYDFGLHNFGLFFVFMISILTVQSSNREHY